MPYAIELYLDKETSMKINEIYSTLRESGINIDEGTRPHVSLCIYEYLPIVEFENDLKQFAKETRPFEVIFSHVDAFQTEQPVIFLAPEITPELLDVHRKFHDSFSKYGDDVWEYYKPKVWVPHCTLCMDLSQDMYKSATEILKGVKLPINARFEKIGTLEFRPNKQLSVFDLG